MKSYTWTTITDKEATVALKVGDIFASDDTNKKQFEIGENDTVRGLIDGKVTSDWKPISDAMVEKLCRMKKHFCVKTEGPTIDVC